MFNNKLCIKFIHCGNVNPANTEDRAEKNIFFLPMGIFPLATLLKDHGCDVEIIHSDLLDTGSLEDAAADWTQVDAAGFDCHWVNQSLAVVETAEMIKRLNPGIFIFLGGYTASLFAEEIINDFPQIDAVIRGDGEIPVVTLIQRIREALLPGNKADRDARDLEDVPNLVWRRHNKQTAVNAFSYVSTGDEMEKLDFADMELMRNWNYYRLSARFWSRFAPANSTPLFFLEPGRGCRYTCLFCGGNALAQKIISNRSCIAVRSTDSVMETIRKAGTYGFSTFFSSFEFRGSDAWYRELCRKIRKADTRINYIFGSWKLPSHELIDVFSECCNQVIFEISPETADEALRCRNKDAGICFSNKQLEACLDYMQTKDNVKVQLYFGYFLAYDTLQTIHRTFDYISALALKYHRIAELEYFNFATDPASLLYLYPEKYDIEMYVNSFADYIRFIKEYYITKKGQAADLRVFVPRGLSLLDTLRIESKVKVFNSLFGIFRKTISSGLLETQDSRIVSGILAEYENRVPDFNAGEPEKIIKLKDTILDIFRKYKITGADTHMMAEGELANHKKSRQTGKATPRIWVDALVNGIPVKQPVTVLQLPVNCHPVENSRRIIQDIEFDL